MKRKTEPPPYIPPNAEEQAEDKRRKRVRNRLHIKPVIEEKQAKVIVNLNRCSQNWKTVVTSLPPKVAFKRQQIKNSMLDRSQKLAETRPQEVSDETKIWFDVDKVFLPEAGASVSTEAVQIVDEFSEKKEVKITKAIGIDCEMVGVGENGKDSILARVSLVNSAGECFYDKYVQASEKVMCHFFCYIFNFNIMI